MDKDTPKKYISKLFSIDDDGKFPNSSLPVILYKNVLPAASVLPSLRFKILFKKNSWSNSWKNGVYDFHHYHSATHEVMGICNGSTTLLVGGENGIKIKVERGDVLIIPAGVAHKNIGPEKKFLCIGAYPNGKDYDMNYGNFVERPQADENIKKVPVPEKDPVFGLNGELGRSWSEK